MFSHSMRRANGYAVVSSVDGSQEDFDTCQCGHCGAHWKYRPGSGRLRGYCMHCMKLTCGAKACLPCIPIEARLDHAEGRKTNYDDTIRQLVAEGAVLL